MSDSDYKTVESLEELNSIKESSDAFLLYVSTTNCNVCKILKPKISDLFKERFPKVELYYVNSDNTPEVSGQLSIFAVPTVLLYLNGQEFARESRSISIELLASKVQRPYNLFFD